MKVGDYVRTLGGHFGIIEELNHHEGCAHSIEMADGYYLLNEKEFKSSPNIIDLIEVGDYVNGEKVIRLFNPTFLSMGELPYVITDKSKYEPQEIKSIVTREMFESMEYKVGE